MRIEHRSRIILAGLMGNLIEAFDMAICGLLSVYLAKYLVTDSISAIYTIFLTFFAGYIARPAGAFVIGLMSDIYGRKSILAASVFVMGLATSIIGFIPSHAQIGFGSVLILLMLRITQSFACGTEYLNSSAYLIECADHKHRGLSGSWASFGSMAGLLLASVMALIVHHLCETTPDLEWWIWRIPFLIAFVGSAIGFFIRLCVPESLEYVLYYAEHAQPKFTTLLKNAMQHCSANKLKAINVFLLSLLGVTTTFLIYIYGPIQAHYYARFSDQQVMISNIISLSFMLLCFPLFGKLSDGVERTNIIVFAAIGFFVLSLPFFYALSFGNFSTLILCQLLVTVPAAAYYATVPVYIAEMFPVELRCTVLSILYSLAACLAGGLMPVLSFYLVRTTHIATSPSWVISLFVVAALAGLSLRDNRMEVYQSA